MPRARPDDGALFPLPSASAGRHERRMGQALNAAATSGRLDPDHAGYATLLRSLARALDVAEVRQDPRATASVGRELLAALVAAGLVPTSTTRPADPFAALLSDLEHDPAARP